MDQAGSDRVHDVSAMPATLIEEGIGSKARLSRLADEFLVVRCAVIARAFVKAAPR